MQLQPWYHSCSAGFTLRGEHSVPSGKPVLHFVHGNGYCSRTYQPMLELLAPDFDLFLSDVQGHGNSDHGGRFHGWNRTADLCLEAWRSKAGLFGDVPVYAVGHSFGAVLTGLMLSRHPNRCKRAVLLDPVLFTPAMIGLMALSDVVGLYARNTLAQRARKRRAHWPDRETAFRALHERGMFKGWREEALWAYVNHALKDVEGGVELKCKPAREAEVFGSYPRRLWASLERVHTPTLVLRGDRSYPFAAKAISRWAAQNPSIQEQEVPGGHCFMQEDPETSATLIRDFLLHELRAAA
ncbi:alpha/beta fold hydrolase [Azoarcus sp. TTM-91]|uniref:alpha/beta fold hydrolase n=1 Tax=Azoarcus sp. TTM-91 TaxID=2691581 RepID=UPI00145EEB74|nr:alpha/beta hydrolase [Azoarcus sp. TTM-91]NMG33999.1 alpha/beta fold hydrolase [Azoarcus sp. TTM-91]